MCVCVLGIEVHCALILLCEDYYIVNVLVPFDRLEFEAAMVVHAHTQTKPNERRSSFIYKPIKRHTRYHLEKRSFHHYYCCYCCCCCYLLFRVQRTKHVRVYHAHVQLQHKSSIRLFRYLLPFLLLMFGFGAM